MTKLFVEISWLTWLLAIANKKARFLKLVCNFRGTCVSNSQQTRVFTKEGWRDWLIENTKVNNLTVAIEQGLEYLQLRSGGEIE